jgi:methylase of polypeptide subunit release factors
MCVVIGMHHRPNARCAQGYFRSSNERSAHATGIDDAIDDEPHALARRTVAGFVHDAGVAAELEHAVDTNAARIVGETLRTAGYTEAAITAALGDDAFSSRLKDLPVLLRRLPQSRLGTVLRAFFLVQPVPRTELVRAIGERGVASLEAAGVADVGDDVVPRMRILPVAGLLVASDDDPTREDDELPTDFVAAYTAASRLCDALTPRPEVDRALDVGTGSGVHALLAARHAREVVATDVNPRALAYTRLNAALNGIRNVECREGSLFEPVQGETFDLITCNAPYVVSPETRWAYRDGGFGADEVSQRVVATAAEHLNDGGYAALLVSWLGVDESKPDERALEWTDATGCDAWVLPIWGGDPLTHAATWNDHLTEDSDAYETALHDWTTYLADLGFAWVSEGGVLLHRRDGADPTVRVDQVEEDDLEDAGDQILRAFESRAVLAEMATEDALLDSNVAVAGPIRLELSLEPEGTGTIVMGASVSLDEGTHPSLDVSADMIEVLAALDGAKRYGDTIESVAKSLDFTPSETQRLRRDALEIGRELLELGALCFE